MTSFSRWPFASLTLAAGLILPTVGWGEEFCAECAQKDSFSHAQKYHDGVKGSVYQKGHAQKGYGHKGHGHHLKEHKWFFSEHPPAAPIFESAAIRRVPVPQQVNFRIQRESGQLRAESAPAPQAESAAAPSDINTRLTNLEKHVARLYESLDKLVDQLQPE